MPLPSFVADYTVSVKHERNCCGPPPLVVTVSVTRGQPVSRALVLSWLRGTAEFVAAMHEAGPLMGSTVLSEPEIGAAYRFAGARV